MANDIASQVLAIKSSGGLTIDFTPLESILLNISQTLKTHDVIVAKFSDIETVQSSLRKDLNKLWTTLESATRQDEYDDDAFDETNATSDEDLEARETSAAGDKGTDSYGLKKCNIESIQRKRADDLDKAEGTEVTNGLRDVKRKIRQLQQESDETLANSLELDENFKKLKDDLLSLQQRFTTTVSLSQLQVLQQSMVAKYGHIEVHINEFKSTFREEVHQSINEYLVDVKASFTALESFLKQRQDKMDTRVTSCAKEYDIAALRDSVESEIASLTRKTSFLDETAKAQGKALVVIQQKNAIATFHRRYCEWKRNALQLGITRWKQVVQRHTKYEWAKISQKRTMKKILTNIMSRRKRAGWEKFIRYRDWHRKTERLKVKASALVYERLEHYLTSSKTDAFHKWRRMLVADKMKCTYDSDVEEIVWLSIDAPRADTQLLDNSGCPGNDIEMPVKIIRQLAKPTAARRDSQYNLNSIIDSLKTDAYGSSCALAKEIEYIKSHDIATLRKDWVLGNEQLMSKFNTTIEEVIRKTDIAAAEFQKSIGERVDTCDAQFPPIHSHLKELTNLFKSHKTQLKNIEESNGKRLDTLFDQTGGLKHRLSLVEELARNTSVQVASILEGQSKYNDAIQHLSQAIADNEGRRDEEMNALREIMDHFEAELLKTKVALGHTQVRCENLEKELATTKQELSYFQDTSQEVSDQVAEKMNHPGIQRTDVNRIVRVGHAYEILAKEKNYVTGINVIATMTSITGQSMKSDGEKRRREELVDVPAEIAAFAHDYAEWIAYQADHESLLKLVAGTNPDEQVYAEDDMVARRKTLLEELKSNLSAELERVAYPGVVDSPDATTRGLGLRWEARAIFLARVLDATKAALSKHDQISLPAETRLGKTRPGSAAVTVCVACDRPMRSKQRSQESTQKGNKASVR